MKTESMDQLLMNVFAELVKHWEPEEVICDLEKVELMASINEALENKPVAIPEQVLQLYQKVYLRDVWRTTDKPG